jgi:D-erythro-7,8-dihydroneopterin triphosphate epimerase
MELATIRIKNLRLRTHIGIKEDEIQNKQDVIINVVLRYPAENAVESNVIDSAVNYRTICKEIISLVEGNKFALLERMTGEVLSLVMRNPHVKFASVEIDKPHALRFADSVSLTLEESR